MQEAKDERRLREENEKTIAEIRETKRAMKQLKRQYDWLVQRTKELYITPYKQDGFGCVRQFCSFTVIYARRTFVCFIFYAPSFLVSVK